MDNLREAYATLDIEAWLSEYVPTKTSGDECMIECCPQCLNSKYKLYVNMTTKRWICHVCEFGRHQHDPAVLMAAVSGRTVWDIHKEILSIAIPTPAELFSTRLQSVFDSLVSKKAARTEQREVDLPGTAEFSGLVGRQVIKYALARGLTEEEIRLYQLRHSYKLDGHPGPFLIFPVYYAGHAVSYQGRRSGKEEPRYVSEETIGDWLWPIDRPFLAHLQYKPELVLVEGVFDACGFLRIGIPAACTFGKKISDRQIALLKAIGVKSVKIAWDVDACHTSEKRLARGAKNIRGETENVALRLAKNFDTHVIDFSNGPALADGSKIDPGEILREPKVIDFFKARVQSAINVRSVEFFQWQLGTPVV